MKLYHYSMLFMIVAIPFIVMTELGNIRQNDVDVMIRSLERTLMRSLDAAVISLAMEGGADDELARENAVEAFFDSLEAGLGLMNDPFSQALLRDRICCLVITGEKEHYVCKGELSEIMRSYVQGHPRDSITVFWKGIPINDEMSYCDMDGVLNAGIKSKYRIVSDIC